MNAQEDFIDWLNNNQDQIVTIQRLNQRWLEFQSLDFFRYFFKFRNQIIALRFNAQHYKRMMAISFRQFAAELRFVPWEEVAITEVPDYLNLRSLRYIAVGAADNTVDFGVISAGLLY